MFRLKAPLPGDGCEQRGYEGGLTAQSLLLNSLKESKRFPGAPPNTSTWAEEVPNAFPACVFGLVYFFFPLLLKRELEINSFSVRKAATFFFLTALVHMLEGGTLDRCLTS